MLQRELRAARRRAHIAAAGALRAPLSLIDGCFLGPFQRKGESVVRIRKTAGKSWGFVGMAALAACASAGGAQADAAGKASPYLSAFESAAGGKSSSLSVDGRLGGFVLGANKLVFVDKASQKLWLVTTKDGCDQPFITDDGSVVTQDAQGHGETCHFKSIQPVNREKLSRILASRANGADVFSTLPLLGPPPHDTSMNHMSNTASNSGNGVK